MITTNTALLIVDVQNGFDDDAHWGARNNPDAETRIAELLRVRRESGPVVHVQHLSRDPESPLRAGQAGVEIKSVVRPLPGETVVHGDRHLGVSVTHEQRASGW